MNSASLHPTDCATSTGKHRWPLPVECGLQRENVCVWLSIVHLGYHWNRKYAWESINIKIRKKLNTLSTALVSSTKLDRDLVKISNLLYSFARILKTNVRFRLLLPVSS